MFAKPSRVFLRSARIVLEMMTNLNPLRSHALRVEFNIEVRARKVKRLTETIDID